MEKPLGPQFVRVYHSSHEVVPPHRVNAQHGPDHDFGMANTHEDIIHAGTMKAAQEIAEGIGSGENRNKRQFIHVYDIPSEHQYPYTFGDDFDLTFSPEDEDRFPNASRVPEFKEKMKGTQPELFESVTGTPDIALKSNKAVPYRNRGEDIGSISWMMPKSAIREGKIRYAGVRTTNQDLDQ